MSSEATRISTTLRWRSPVIRILQAIPPAEFSRLQFEGRGVILATSNGTRLLAELAGAPAVLAGCLLNRTAAAKVAVEMARGRRLDILVVCSAAYAGATFVLEVPLPDAAGPPAA